jgi:hypothetical protein
MSIISATPESTVGTYSLELHVGQLAIVHKFEVHPGSDVLVVVFSL